MEMKTRTETLQKLSGQPGELERMEGVTLNLRDFFQKEFKAIGQKFEERYDGVEFEKIYSVLENEIVSLIEGMPGNYCCEKEMVDIVGNMVSECNLRRRNTPEENYYQKADAALLEFS